MPLNGKHFPFCLSVEPKCLVRREEERKEVMMYAVYLRHKLAELGQLLTQGFMALLVYT